MNVRQAAGLSPRDYSPLYHSQLLTMAVWMTTQAVSGSTTAASSLLDYLCFKDILYLFCGSFITAINTSASVFIRLCSYFIFHVGGRENKTLTNN